MIAKIWFAIRKWYLWTFYGSMLVRTVKPTTAISKVMSVSPGIEPNFCSRYQHRVKETS
jgi:hypothetical protein